MGNIPIMTTKAAIASIFTVTLCLFFLSSSYAGIYKWVDENGQVHYGERPGSATAEQVTIRKDETTKPREIKTPDDDQEKQDGESQQAELPDGEAPAPVAAKPEIEDISQKEKRQLCNEAKSDIAAINSRGRIREVSATGEYVYLSEEQRQQRLSAARKKQQKYCR